LKDLKKPSIQQVLASLPGLFIYLYCVFFSPGTSFEISIGIAALLVNLWIAEPFPIWLSSLFPLVLMPLHGILDAHTIFKSYFNNTILLFFGGFLLAYSVEKWHLHKRIAFKLLALTGDNPKGIIWGMMLSTCLISMWISNTATAIMMLPVAISIVNIIKDKDSKTNKAFFTCLLLGIAYGANIGGIATIIGTPPNIVYKGLSESLLNKKVGFLEWMVLGVPLSLLMLWLSYQLMVNVFFKVKTKTLPEDADLLDKQAEQLGKIKHEEKRTLMVFSAAIFFWVFAQPLNHLIESLKWPFKIEEFSVALIFGGLLFLIPKEPKSKQRLLEFNDFKYIAWGILILFGGGMCMAKGLENTGVIKFVGEWIKHNQEGDFRALLFLIILSALFLTELMSNVALAQIYVPVVFGISQSLGIENPHIMGITVTIACSFAFMFPISTPPNAVVFSSGKIKLRDMAIAGFFLNIVGVILLWLSGLYIIPLLF
jgi:sodium-dependent dicarboxylate transporter 2/3/5